MPRISPMSLKGVTVALVALAAAVVVVAYFRELVSGRYLIRCPFYSLTGLKCAGCGGQRALHSLLNGEFREAMSQNAMILFFPLYVAGVFFRPLYESRWYVFGGAFVILGYMIVRNIV